MMKQHYLRIFLFFLISCQSSSTFNWYIDKNNQPQITHQHEVIMENLIVLGEHDCLGCLEHKMEGKELIFTENQAQHQYQLELTSSDGDQANLLINGNQTGEVYFGFSNMQTMQKGYLLLADRVISFQSFGEFASQLQESKEGVFLFHLRDKYVAIKAKDGGKAANQYGMFGFVLEELPGEVLITAGTDSLQVVRRLGD